MIFNSIEILLGTFLASICDLILVEESHEFVCSHIYLTPKDVDLFNIATDATVINITQTCEFCD